MTIKTAVFPVAGTGSRVSPITAFISKEMLPLADKPLIHYAIEEALMAGIERFVFITRPAKALMNEYIEYVFSGLKKEVIFINQLQQRGLGDAVAHYSPVAGKEPFAVILPDDFMVSKDSLSNMIACYSGQNMASVTSVPQEDVSKYGILIDPIDIGNNILEAKGVLEKPKSTNFTHNYAIVGRYILGHKILELLKCIEPGVGGEVQLSDALDILAKENGLQGFKLQNGDRIDCGTKAGLLLGTLHTARMDPELSKVLNEFEKREIIEA